MKDIQIPQVDEVLKKKAQGGQEIEPLAKARNMLWCKGVKDLTDIKNNKLDKMFVWRNAGDHLKYAPAKIFERIEKVGMYPRGKGGGLKRSLPEIVEVVNQHPTFQGTAVVFNSKLWELLELKSISVDEVLERIDDVFFDYGVKRYPLPEREESWRLRRNPALDVPHPVNVFEMRNLLDANLHAITGIYLEVLYYFFTKTTILITDKRMFGIHTNSLKEYFEEKLGNFGRECALVALERIQGMDVTRLFRISLNDSE